MVRMAEKQDTGVVEPPELDWDIPTAKERERIRELYPDPLRKAEEPDSSSDSSPRH